MTTVLSVFFAIAVLSFVLALWSLRAADDMTALALCALGALSLRALHQAARIAEGSS